MLKDNSNYTWALVFSGLLALVIFVCHYLWDKQTFFLMLNGDLGPVADYYFRFFTYLGDGIFWIPIAVLVWRKRRRYFPVVLSAFLLSTALTQVFKYFILPGAPRPTRAISDALQIHVVPNVTVHTISSFPSGHTATAFCFFILGCLFFRSRLWLAFGFLGASLVGYSRVYLAQHFPFDVAGGIVVAIVSMTASMAIFKQMNKGAGKGTARR